MGGEFWIKFESEIEFRNSLWPTYRVDVGKRETTEEMSVVDETLASEMYPAASKSVETASFAQYNPIAHVPEINKPKTEMVTFRSLFMPAVDDN